MPRPDPVKFALVSYVLSIISAGIVAFSMLVGFLPIDALKTLSRLIWLTIPVAGVGAFLGYAASLDFKKQEDPPDQAVRNAVLGFRYNVAALGVVLFLACVGVVISLVTSSAR